LVGRQEGHPPVKNIGDSGGGHWLVWMEWRPAGWSVVGVSASVNLLLHHKVQKFSSGTGSPGWSQRKGGKTVVVCGAISMPTPTQVLIAVLSLTFYSHQCLCINCTQKIMARYGHEKAPSQGHRDDFSNIVADREFSTGCYLFTWDGDGAGNTVEENSSVFSIIRMR